MGIVLNERPLLEGSLYCGRLVCGLELGSFMVYERHQGQHVYININIGLSDCCWALAMMGCI